MNTMISNNNNHFISSDVNEKETEQFQRDGFVFINDVVSKEMVSKVKERVSPLFHGNFETGIFPDEWHWRPGLSKDDITREIVNAWKCDRRFAQMVLDERLGKIVAKLMGWSGARIAQDDVFWKPIGGKPIGFHQDQPYMGYFTPNSVATMWIALTDVSMTNGTLEYVKGSHLWPTTHTIEEAEFHAPDNYLAPLAHAAASAGQSEYPRTPVEITAGSCSVHHGMMWHGSATNPSPLHERISVAIHYIPAESEFNSTKPVGYIYGRYKMYQSNRLDESFFPIVYQANGYRSECISTFI
ncbi:hypothetical protein SAMD00019534_054540, partial [Acytostelium subglobosum LB1]|uniref:hypothetical protein n=1 Tax=Acytostelium subglobosum LB1 TaxID=1410327 RepID=UPI0006451054